jgi:hypothetical protein
MPTDFERLYGTPTPAAPAQTDFQRLYGTPTPPPPAAAPATPPPDAPPARAGAPGLNPQYDTPDAPPPTPRWRLRIDTGDRAGAEEYEFTGDWPAAQEELKALRQEYPASARIDVSPLTAPGAGDGITREAPLEEVMSPVDLVLSGYGAGVAVRGGARQGARLLGNVLGNRWGRAAGASLASEALYKGRQAVGLEPGRLLEIGTPDLLNFGVPFGAETLSTLSGAAVRHSRAGEALTEANAQTRANRSAYDAQTAEQQAAYTQKTADRATAIQTHTDKIPEALALTTKYAPAVPSSTLYDDLDATYGHTLQNIRPLHETARRLKTVLGEHDPGPLLGPVRKVIEDVLHHDELTPFATVHEDIKRLGLLTRSADPQARQMAGELFGAAHESVSRSSDMYRANKDVYPALQQATATFRHEKALEDVDLMVSANVPTGNDAVDRLRAGNIRTRLDTKVRNDPHFRESFPPGQLDALGVDIDQLNNLPKVGTPPTAPVPGPPPADVHPTLAPRDTGYRRLAEVLTGPALGTIFGHHEAGLGVGLGLAAADIGWDQAQRWLVQHPATLERLMEEGLRVPYKTLGTLSVLGR